MKQFRLITSLLPLIVFINGCAGLNLGKGYHPNSMEVFNKNTQKKFDVRAEGRIYKGAWHSGRFVVFDIKEQSFNNGQTVRINFRSNEIYIMAIGIFPLPLIPICMTGSGQDLPHGYFDLVPSSPNVPIYNSPLYSLLSPDGEDFTRDSYGVPQDANRTFEIINSYYLFKNKTVANVCSRIYVMKPYLLKDKYGDNVLDAEGKLILLEKRIERKGVRCRYPKSSDAILHLTLKYIPTNEKILLKIQLNKDWWWTYHPFFSPMT